MISENRSVQHLQGLRWYQKIQWGSFIFFTVLAVATVTLWPLHLYKHGIDWRLWSLFFFMYGVTVFCITGGYHRCFSHLAYNVHPLAKVFFLIFGSAAWQASALEWVADHRRHHRMENQEGDPYNIKKGFWWAHIGWIFSVENPKYKDVVPTDLVKDPWFRFQHNYYIPLASIMSFGFPAAIGALWGDALGGLLYGGIFRLFCVHHSTFFINSFCHMFGYQPYGTSTTARDNILLAVVTFGEGYHNFHHRFPRDYRNGVRWYQFDPTKWLIIGLRYTGLAHDLKATSKWDILKARMSLQQPALISKGINAERLQAIKDAMENAHIRIQQLKEDYREMKLNFQQNSHLRMLEIKTEIRKAKLDFKLGYRQWLGIRNFKIY